MAARLSLDHGCGAARARAPHRRTLLSRCAEWTTRGAPGAITPRRKVRLEGYGPKGHTVQLGAIDAPVVYPPLALDELAIVGRLHLAWSGGRFPDDGG